MGAVLSFTRRGQGRGRTEDEQVAADDGLRRVEDVDDAKEADKGERSAIESQLGAREDFERLLAAAHRLRPQRVASDLV
eukprot:1627987-Prymnesium_polylepis.2